MADLLFVLLELILTDQLADLPSSRSATRSEWQFEIFCVKAHMGRSTGRSTPIDLPLDLNGNLRFFMLELIWADQLADLPPSFSTGHHGMYIMGCI